MGLLVAANAVLPGASRPHLRALTSIRFFAALHVALAHSSGGLISRDAARIHAEAVSNPDLPRHVIDLLMQAVVSFLGAAQASVSLFFVLSGFILTYNYLDPATSCSTTRRQFWLARFARVYPVYLLAWLIAAPAALQYLLRPDSHTSIFKLSLLPLLSLTATHAWLPDWALEWNSPSWSLCTETMFYAAFPLFFLATGAGPSRTPAGQERRSRHLLHLCAWLLLAMVPPALYVLVSPDGIELRTMITTSLDISSREMVWLRVMAYFPLIRLPELLAGVALGRIFLMDVREGRQAPRWLLPACLTLVILILVTRNRWIPFPFLAGGAMAPIFAVLIYGLAHGGLITRLLSGDLLVLLGEASYALYILHVPLAGWFRLAARKTAPGIFQGLEGELARTPTWGYLLLYLAIAILVSVASFKLFETPARYFIRDFVRRRGAGSTASRR